MNVKKKCSSQKHELTDAIIYCQECNIFMCNKCLSFHSELFESHTKYNLDKNIEEIFTGICKEENHKQELEFYCKDHNKLCCSACLSKIKGNGNGQHFNCDVCIINDIKDDKKNKLVENIKYLEELSNNLENLVKELKNLFEMINNNKEKLKLDISKIFTKIRNVINEREDQLLLEVDNKFDNLFFEEEIVNQTEKLPNKVKIYLEKGKKINNEWNDNKKINNLINDCINIENKVEDIKKLDEIIQKCRSIEKNFKFIPEKDNEINEFLEKIKKFGNIGEEDEENDLVLKFKFRPGKNYTVSKNGFVAQKNSGGKKMLEFHLWSI